MSDDLEALEELADTLFPESKMVRLTCDSCGFELPHNGMVLDGVAFWVCRHCKMPQSRRFDQLSDQEEDLYVLQGPLPEPRGKEWDFFGHEFEQREKALQDREAELIRREIKLEKEKKELHQHEELLDVKIKDFNFDRRLFEEEQDSIRPEIQAFAHGMEESCKTFFPRGLNLAWPGIGPFIKQLRVAERDLIELWQQSGKNMSARQRGCRLATLAHQFVHEYENLDKEVRAQEGI